MIKESDFCAHESIAHKGNIQICMNCGEKLKQIIKCDERWKYETYTNETTKSYGRCYIRQEYEKSIYKDIESMNFPILVKNKANDIFTQVTNNKTKRARKRAAVIFGCIYNSYKILYNRHKSVEYSMSFDNLREIFKIEKKRALKGIRTVCFSLPKDSEVNWTYANPRQLIGEYMLKCSANHEQIEEVYKLFDKVDGKSSLLVRSRPKSTSAAIIFYYIDKFSDKNISLKVFKNIIGITELTVKRIYNDIDRILTEENDRILIEENKTDD